MATTSPTPPCTIRWPVEVTRPAENFTQVYRGEAVRICCILAEYAKPMDLTGATGEFYWQPCQAADPTRWWSDSSGSVEVSGSTVSILWNSATMDDGSGSYRCFFRLTTPAGATYRANGVVAMLPSPGATPNEIPFPIRTLDFATVRILNAPWSVDGILKGDGAGGISAAVAGTDFATPADATLSGRGFDEWTITAANETTLELTDGGWVPMNGGSVVGVAKGDAESTSLSWSAETNPPESGYDIAATRTALPGYVLGSQTDKPVADADETAAAISAKYSKPSGGIPKTDLASGVQASLDKADAALPTSGGTMSGDIGFSTNGRFSIGKRDGVSGLTVYDHQAEEGSDLVPNGSPFAHENQIPAVSAETWTFTVDDGQGGTTTVTKSVAVFAQGGA